MLITISSNCSVYKRFLRNFISSTRTRFSCSHFNSLVLYPVRSLLVLRNVFCKWSLNCWFPLLVSPSCMSSYIFISLFSLQKTKQYINERKLHGNGRGTAFFYVLFGIYFLFFYAFLRLLLSTVVMFWCELFDGDGI